MTTRILAEVSGSVSELKKNPMAFVRSGRGEPVVVLNRNTPEFYCVPAKTFEALMDMIEDAELAALVKARANEKEISVNLDDLDKL
jgi:antitoxin StbD